MRAFRLGDLRRICMRRAALGLWLGLTLPVFVQGCFLLEPETEKAPNLASSSGSYVSASQRRPSVAETPLRFYPACSADPKASLPNARCCTTSDVDSDGQLVHVAHRIGPDVEPRLVGTTALMTEGLVPVVTPSNEQIGDGAKMGAMDQTGKLVIPFAWDFIGWFCEGLAVVCDGCRRRCDDHGCDQLRLEGGAWGYVDRTGDVVVPLSFESGTEFYYGIAHVRHRGRDVLIDKQGQIVGGQ